jgi:hypothetical protein
MKNFLDFDNINNLDIENGKWLLEETKGNGL